MSCDICGKVTTSTETLNTRYQTDEFKQVCCGCSKILNDHLWKVRKITLNMTTALVKEFMYDKKHNAKAFK